MKLHFIMVLLFLFPAHQAVQADGPVPPGDTVILLHGLGRTQWSMKVLEQRLEARGYHVINESYPSRHGTMMELSEGYLHNLITKRVTDSSRPVHFVTHSLGGILLRYYLNQHPVPNLGRVVMLAPPNQGSELTDELAHIGIYGKITGPAGRELGTGPEALPRELGPVRFELGVIAGNKSLNPIYSRLIPGLDDGKVSLKSARVEGMKDFLVVPHSHTWIMNREKVFAQVVHFLEQGHFLHPAVSPVNMEDAFAPVKR